MTLTESPQRERRHPVRADVRLSSMDGAAIAEVVMTDLSSHGMGTDGLMHFPPESMLRVEFPDGSTRMGQAMWHDSFWSGIRFDVPLAAHELAGLIALLTSQPHFSQRAA
jgi:hypothetical protein